MATMIRRLNRVTSDKFRTLVDQMHNANSASLADFVRQAEEMGVVASDAQLVWKIFFAPVQYADGFSSAKAPS